MNKKNKRDMKRDIILFTGQSGIKVEKCLEKLREPKFPLPIKIEREMIKTYKKIFPQERRYDDRKIVIKILSLPPSTQRKLWDKSFKLATQKLKKEKSQSVYFLCFHTCFYHQKNREFLSPINLLKLRSLSRRTKMVIVFVDDCYDIYRRLLNDGEMFFEDVIANNVRPQEAMIKSIWNLLTILTWREIEVAFSRKVAEILRVPLFIVPVKHPIFMIKRLIFAPLVDLRIFYLAHPITSIRKRVYARTAKFPEKLNEFTEKCLRKKDNLVLFIPDTIDELRIKKEDEMYIPDLEKGWSLPFEEDKWLFHPLPNRVRLYNPLNPKNFDHLSNKKKSISYVVGILAKKIDEQITSRDYGLIEQSKDGMIIYQPYWEGDISGGALKEAKYNRDLRDTEEERKTFILEKKENLGKYRIKELFLELGTRALKKVDDGLKKELNKLRENWEQDSNWVLEFYRGDASISKIRPEIEKKLPRDYDFSNNFLRSEEPSLHGAPMHEREQRLRRGWEALYDKINNLDPFKQQCSDLSKEYIIISSHKFERRLYRFLDVIFSKRKEKQKRR